METIQQSIQTLVIGSLRGRRLKGKGKGVLGARETQGAREEGGLRLSSLNGRPQLFLIVPSVQISCFRKTKEKHYAK